MIEGVALDAYGTLFDVYSVEQKCEKLYPGFGQRISQTWRQKQLEYSWLRTLMGRYQNFWHVTEDALRYTLAELGLAADKDNIETLMRSYLKLEMYSEVPLALDAFGSRKKVILTNGDLDMIEPLMLLAGLNKQLDGCLSADETGMFKVRPEVYQLAVDRMGIEKSYILFVSSNGWDVAGAKAFGFTVGWVNRRGLPPEELGVRADYEASNLLELALAVEGA